MGKLISWGEWYLTPNRVPSCEECPWYEDEEICTGCKKPDRLFPENFLAWSAWLKLSEYGREGMSGRLMLSEVTSFLCQIDGDMEDMEKVLALERIFQEKREKDNK